MSPVNPAENQTVTVPLSADTVAKLTGQAQRQGQTLGIYLQQLAQRKSEGNVESAGPTNGAAPKGTSTIAIPSAARR